MIKIMMVLMIGMVLIIHTRGDYDDGDTAEEHVKAHCYETTVGIRQTYHPLVRSGLRQWRPEQPVMIPPCQNTSETQV